MRKKALLSIVQILGYSLMLCLPAALAQDFDLRLDYARYKYDEQSSLLEIFYSFDMTRLSLRQANGDTLREAILDLRILHNDSLWATNAWRMQLSAKKSSPNQIDNRTIDLLRYIAGPGRYHVELTIRDASNQITQKAALNLQVEPMPPANLWMSDIKLAAAIRQEKPDSLEQVFYKNNFVVVPQPDRSYSSIKPLLFYYLENYNLAGAPGASYKVKCYVTDLQGNVLNNVRGRTMTKPKNMEASVEVGSLHLGGLLPGEYLLNVETLSADDSVLGKQSKPFYMLASTSMSALPAVRMTMGKFAGMTDKEIEAEFKKAVYICSKEEQKMFEELRTLEGKKQFLAELWGRRDPTPSTPENEFYTEYQRRLEYANESLRSFARAGWQTDRGRAYIVYGPPSDIERFPSSDANRPYERWQYDNIDGGVEFIFIDRTGFKEYRLVHSTKFGEISDSNWTRLLPN